MPVDQYNFRFIISSFSLWRVSTYKILACIAKSLGKKGTRCFCRLSSFILWLHLVRKAKVAMVFQEALDVFCILLTQAFFNILSIIEKSHFKTTTSHLLDYHPKYYWKSASLFSKIMLMCNKHSFEWSSVSTTVILP